MSISNEQILEALLIFYQRRGVDLAHLISDPVFSKMPIQDRIQFLNKHSKTLLQGSSAGLSSSEKGYVLADALLYGVGGAAVAIPAINKLRAAAISAGKIRGVNQSSIAGIVMGVGVGALLGSMSGYMKAQSLKDSRAAVRNQLMSTSNSPNLSNAVGVLSAAGIHSLSAGPRNAILNRIRDTTDRFADNAPVTLATNYFNNIHNEYHPKS